MAKDAKKKGASPVLPMLLVILVIAMLGLGVWLLPNMFWNKKGGADEMQYEITMMAGEQKTLEVAFKSAFTCSTSDAAIVSFDPETNLLTAHTAGQATLVAKDITTGECAFYLVKVNADPNAPATTPSQTTTTEVTTTTELTTTTTAPLPPGSVTGISLTYYAATVKPGEKYKYALVTMQPADAIDKREKWTTTDERVATVDQYGNIYGMANGTCTIRVTSVSNPNVYADIAVTVSDGSTAELTTAPNGDSGTAQTTPAQGLPSRGDIEVRNGLTYVQGILIANKTYPLPASYNPGLLPETQAAFNEMQKAAAKEGLSLTIKSGFRSYSLQQTLYNNYVSRDGKAAADRYSARPGYSEHQTGLALDINKASDSFTNTPEAKWLAAHCAEYGFILRYPEGKENETGYMYESWHVRYLGKELAQQVTASGKTLEAYLGITSVYAS